MAFDLTNLTNAVTALEAADKRAEDNMTALTAKINTLIAQSGNTVNPADVQALVDRITAANTALDASTTANQPPA